MVQEIRRDGSTTYVYSDTDSYVPLARIDTQDRAREYTRIYWYHTRPDGTPEQLSDSNGEEVWRIVNDAWGRVDTAWGEINSAAVREDNLRMQGQYLDRETGLHYNLFRYYDADSMHFISPDPIGLAGGLNLYAYAPDPVNWADPWGLSKCPTVTRGQNGEVLTARATVSPADLKTGTGINASARVAARAMGFQTDDAGHILAKALGGQGGKANVFPQLPAVNRGEYRVFEDQVRKYIEKNGAVDIDWSFKYGNGGTRPTEIFYDVYQGGVKIFGRAFKN